jgi:hypothetical protein
VFSSLDIIKVDQEGWRYENLKEWNNDEKPAFDERTEVQKSFMKVYVWASFNWFRIGTRNGLL